MICKVFPRIPGHDGGVEVEVETEDDMPWGWLSPKEAFEAGSWGSGVVLRTWEFVGASGRDVRHSSDGECVRTTNMLARSLERGSH